jgi:hypothetical protein
MLQRGSGWRRPLPPTAASLAAPAVMAGSPFTASQTTLLCILMVLETSRAAKHFAARCCHPADCEWSLRAVLLAQKALRGLNAGIARSAGRAGPCFTSLSGSLLGHPPLSLAPPMDCVRWVRRNGGGGQLNEATCIRLSASRRQTTRPAEQGQRGARI